jgi:hypothetical protein
MELKAMRWAVSGSTTTALAPDLEIPFSILQVSESSNEWKYDGKEPKKLTGERRVNCFQGSLGQWSIRNQSLRGKGLAFDVVACC